MQKRIAETPLVKTIFNEYHFGSSDTGKTYTYIKLCNKFSPEEVYLCNDYSNSSSSGGGFDFYSNNPAKIVVLDEFRGNIPYNVFLSMLDVYSRNQQHCRFQNTFNLWQSVIICSILPPEKVYSFMVEDSERQTDSIKQMMRRLNRIIGNRVMGITPETIEQYTKFMANKRLKEIGMQPLFEGFDSNPYKQLENIADTNGAGSVKGNFFEANVSSYNQSTAIEGWEEI